MHSTACGVSASASNSATTTISMPSTDGAKMVHNNDDAMNKIPLKSANGLDDEEKNAGEFVHDTAAAEEARREQMRVNLLKWMKKLTIVLICFIGLALITYVIISLCFSDWSKTSSSSNHTSTFPTSNSSLLSDDNSATAEAGSSTSESGAATLTTTAATVAVASIATLMDKQTMPVSTASVELPTTAPVTMKTTAATAVAKKTETPLILQDTPPVIDAKFESKLGVYEQAAVCSDKEVCSKVGSQILQQNGSAVDAAIATLLCNGILTMHSMGIGGGMLMNVYIKEKKHGYTIDGREVAPFAAYPEMFDKEPGLSVSGGLSIGVPGELMGYYRAHERFGKLPWKALVEPSIKFCTEGFYLNHHQWMALNIRLNDMKNNTVLMNVFTNPETGKLHPVGTKLKPQKELCDTYALLAENGPLDFYNGTLAQLVVEDLKDLGSAVTGYDLEAYVADLVSSITMQLGDDILYASPPVSSGIVVANILSILEGFNFTKADMMGAANQTQTMHRIAEALKFGFAKRWDLGDLRFNDVRELVSKLTNPDYGRDIFAKINESSVLNDIYAYGIEYTGTDDFGTSHVVVLAPNGDAVSVTSSVNSYFGSSQAGKRTGIIFNNVMDDFSVAGRTNYFNLPSSPANYIESRKRPMSSMSPMILADQQGDVHMVIGAAGGAKIISSIVEVMARVLWFGQDIKEAVDAPRIHHQLVPNELEYENGRFSEEMLSMLKAKGHKVKAFKEVGSVVSGIVRNNTAIYANVDFRKRGGSAGF